MDGEDYGDGSGSSIDSSGGVGVGGSASSFQQSDGSSSSSNNINWGIIILLVLLLVGVIALLGLVFQSLRRAIITYRNDKVSIDNDVERANNRGIRSFFPFLLATVGLAASIYCTTTCNFVSLPEVYFDRFRFEAIGFWKLLSYDNGSSCSDYPDDYEFDSTFKVARAMSLLATILGGSCFLASILMRFINNNTPRRRIMYCTMYILFLSTLLQGLSLLAFRSDFCTGDFEECEMDSGSYFAIVACVYWLSSGLALRHMIPTTGGNEAVDDEEPQSSHNVSDDEV